MRLGSCSNAILGRVERTKPPPAVGPVGGNVGDCEGTMVFRGRFRSYIRGAWLRNVRPKSVSPTYVLPSE
jgi:hypothetical protein